MYLQGCTFRQSTLPGGINLVDEEQSLVVAQLYGGSLFVLFDLPHHGAPADVLLREILDRLRAQNPPVLASPDALAVTQLRQQETRQWYGTLCEQRLVAVEAQMTKPPKPVPDKVAGYRVVLNGEYADDNLSVELHEGDTVVLIAGVKGG